MKISIQCFLVLGTVALTNAAFVPQLNGARASLSVKGYLDDLNDELYAPEDMPDIEGDSAENNKMSKEQLDRFGPGNFADFVEFEEFDGGDGQMGVAGDGQTGLDKSDFASPQLVTMDKSRSRSSKNAWGTSTGYAQKLLDNDENIDAARAQQLENWQNQQEVRQRGIEMKKMTETFDSNAEAGEQDWRTLAKFGVERNSEADLDEEFGDVVAGEIEGVIELHSNINQGSAHDFTLKNPFMGFADFRAAIIATSTDWTVTPTEGALSKTAVEFIIRFRPSNPGVQQGYLVIETEDVKLTYQLVGTTA